MYSKSTRVSYICHIGIKTFRNNDNVMEKYNIMSGCQYRATCNDNVLCKKRKRTFLLNIPDEGWRHIDGPYTKNVFHCGKLM